jgi:YD repeat-containing protein
MKQLFASGLVALAGLAAWSAAFAAQPYQEYRKHVEAAQTITALTDELMGDSVSLYNGATEFTATDIDLPGNNALPVQLRRRFSIEITPVGSGSLSDPNYRGAGNWDIDVPHISGVYGPQGWEAARCNDGNEPNVPTPFHVTDVWNGNTVHVPGAGDRKMLKLAWAEIPKPSDSETYKWTTRERDMFTCIPMHSGVLGGEGFLMETTSGLRYYFDVATSRNAGHMTYQAGEQFLPASVGRSKYYLLARKIVDRFGNAVTFTYNAAGHPERIESSDGRVIVLTYVNGRLDKATANGRIWQYQYWTGTPAMLKTVLLPGTNGGKWEYAHTGTLYPDDGGVWEVGTGPDCHLKPPAVAASFSITITHPSGAVGAFQFANKRHPRSGIHARACVVNPVQQNGTWFDTYKLYIPNYFDVMSLGQKSLSGPGLTARTWTYVFPQGNVALWGSRDQDFTYPCTNTTACPVEKTVTVHEPDGTSKQYRYGYLYSANEGRLLGTTTLDENDVVRRTETTTYLPEPPGQQNFYPMYGQGFGLDDPSTLAVRPVIAHTIAQDGATFTMQVKTGCGSAGRYCFDIYGHPTAVTKASSLGYSRDELTEYHNNTSLWILGQPSKTTIGGVVASEAGYNALAMPTWAKSFGKLQQTLTYNTTAGPEEGTVKTITDGRSHVTTLTDWYRGIPQTIQHPVTPESPGGATESAVVDDNGWIKEVTDQNGYVTKYDHDDMGRLTLVDYPDEDDLAWNSTIQSFAPYTAQPKYGIPAGHWQQTVSTGNARKIIYFDALWRPLVEETYDNADEANTRSVTVKRYDTGGRLAFQSYPLRTLSNYATVTTGTSTYYDALDRPRLVRQTSELGNLDTTTQYLAGFKTRVTLPKHQGTNVYTETTYQAWDQPTFDLPVRIDAPEGVSTTITRDVFGKPLEITRSGPDG